ncbi:MAG: lysogenization regulator HflD [Xanthomonadales bacterium]|nr:lysogenization regulator HflD [Xanthomonadales bacterium]
MITQQLKEQTLALAGVFQAAELVHQAATTGQWSGYAAEQSIQSLFVLNPETVEDVYAGEYGVNMGLKALRSALGGEQQSGQILAYAIELLQLEKKYRADRNIRQQIGEALTDISQLGNDNSENTELMDMQATALGELYQKTISTLSTRIMVNGKPRHLQNERTLSWIRTLLFAGLRSARLWVQLGGSRFDLMFGRKKVIDASTKILG